MGDPGGAAPTAAVRRGRGARAAGLALLAGLGGLAACALLPPRPRERAVAEAGRLFRLGDEAGAAAALAPLLGSPQGWREALALRFACQDYQGVLDLTRGGALSAGDDEARLWVARSCAALGRWNACLAQCALLDDPLRPAAQSLRAEALGQLGDAAAPAAMAQALSACAGTALEACTALVAAENAERRGDDAAAEAYYKRAERADPSYSLVNLRLADLYRREERWKDARVRLERARRVDPDAEGPRQALNALLAALPEQRWALRRDEARKARRFLGRPNPAVTPLAALPGEPTVRVGLLTDAPRFKCRLGSAMVASPQGLTLPAGSTWELSRSGQGWQLRPLSPGAGAVLDLGASLRLRPLDPAGTFGLFDVDRGAGYFWASSADRYFRGGMELLTSGAGVTLVDELGLEAYLLSVVPSEVRAGWPAAALRAQAVAARTDAWRSLGRFRSRGYDLCPTVLCAVYAGVGAEDPRSTAAVTATAGMVLRDATGHLAATYYMDNSGGHTLAAAEAWSGRPGNSVGVADVPDGPAGDATRALFPVTAAGLLHFLDDPDGDVRAWPKAPGNSAWRWTLRITPEELAPSVDRRHSVGRLEHVRDVLRSDGGYLREAALLGDQGQSRASSDRIRSAFKGVKSNLFYVEERRDALGRTVAFLFHGGGWGHGVGMSQSGAMAMAASGLDEKAILRHYFPASIPEVRYGKP